MTTAPPPLAGRLRRTRLQLAACWVAMLAWPALAPNDYLLSLGVAFLINLLLVASLNLVMGYAGQVSLAHAAFFGLGAYASGIPTVLLHWNAFAGLGLALLVCSAAAWLIAGPTLRLRGHYLAMGTLGFNAILSVLFVELIPLTGGPNGLAGVAPYSIGAFALDTPGRFFPFAWALSLALMLLLLNLVSGRFGRAARAVSASEPASAAIGIAPFAVKTGFFVVGGGIAGIAGSLYVHLNQFASPETFGVFNSVLLVVMVALGGAGSFFGPLLGALVYTAVPELLRRFADSELLLFGLCMLAVLLFLPGGLASLASVAARGERRRTA